MKTLLLETQNWPDLSSDEALQIEIVNASLRRHEGQHRLSLEAMQELLKDNETSEFTRSMALLQIGISQMAMSLSSEALRSFHEAMLACPNHEFAIVIRINRALCHFNLGLPLKTLTDEIRREVLEIENHPFAKSLSQLDLMLIEQEWQRGDFKAVLSASTPPLTQCAYLQALADSLPWLGPGDCTEKFLESIARDVKFYCKEERRQTLVADARWVSKESTELSLPLLTDRIHLWTWKWMANPASHLSSMLAIELARFPWSEAHLRLTNMDFFYLRSLGGWLSVFNSDFARFFDAWWSKHAPAQLQESLFFNLDFGLSQMLRHNKSIDLKTNPHLQNSSAHVPRAYLNFVVRIETSIKEPLFRLEILQVDLANFNIRVGNQLMTSKPIALLLGELKTHGSLSFADALRIGFEIPDYDDFVHAPKIHNLLQRAKRLLPPGAELRTKDQRLYLEEQLPVIEILTGSIHQKHFPVFDWEISTLGKKQTIGLKKKVSQHGRTSLLELFSDRKARSRLEIQERLRLPKATAGRYITIWLKDRWLQKSGEGKSTKYRLGPALAKIKS